MIRLRDFELTEHDIQSLVPSLSAFDYYLVVTLWPTVADEKDKICKAVGRLRPNELIFAEATDGFDLCNIGFHLRQATSKEVTGQLRQLGDLVKHLSQLAGDKQVAGQDIGIYIRDVVEGREQALDIIRAIGQVATYTITSDKFGNLSYPQGGREIAHVLTDEKGEETLLVPAAHLSSNEIVYEFGEGKPSKQRSRGAIDILQSLWQTPCQIHDVPDRDACTGEFWLSGDSVATVGRFDTIEKMNICISVAAYPKLGALALQLYNEDKRELPVLVYQDALANLANKESIYSAPFGPKVRVLPIPRLEPFTKLKHVLLSFSHR